MRYLIRHIKAAGQLAGGDKSASDQIDDTFNGFAFSLAPLLGLAIAGLMTLATLSDGINYLGAMLLSLIAIIPLSIGPVFLGLVAFAREEPHQAYGLMASFNWLRLRLLGPVLLTSLGILAALQRDLFSLSDMLLPLGLVGALYGLYCIRRAAGLVGSMLECSRPLAFILATIAIFLAVL